VLVTSLIAISSTSSGISGRQALCREKFTQRCIQIGGFRLEDTWHRWYGAINTQGEQKESNMHELTYPVELRDEELNLVAAGSGCRPHPGKGKCCGGDEITQVGLVNLNDTDVEVNILSAG
jgi:hypothetical protein